VKVLLVDDLDIIRDSLQAVIQMEGYVTVSAAGGREALELMKTEQFNVAIIDDQMPEMSGMHLAGILRKFHPDTAVYMMTGEVNKKFLMNLEQIRADGFFAKPLNFTKILSCIKRVSDQKDSEMSS
jgi:DNA-binding NtrC family response regulator